MEMLLIRHGLPVHKVNSDGTPADPPLSRLGREQARLVEEWLAEEGIDRIYSSPMLRARETAEPLARMMNIEVEPPRLFLDAGYASVSRFLAAGTGPHSISSLNEVAHLRAFQRAAS